MIKRHDFALGCLMPAETASRLSVIAFMVGAEGYIRAHFIEAGLRGG